jgi:hypothetical protein
LIDPRSLLGPIAKIDPVSDDIGDVSQIIPTLKALSFGWTGAPHSPDHVMLDPEVACILPAKVIAMTIVDLLWDDAELGSEIVKQFKRPSRKAQRLAQYVDQKRAQERISQYPT